MKDNMSLNTKLEVALEILAAKIAETFQKGFTIDDKEIQNLIKEREELYSGNEKVIDKIINVYSKEIKKKYEEVKK